MNSNMQVIHQKLCKEYATGTIRTYKEEKTEKKLERESEAKETEYAYKEYNRLLKLYSRKSNKAKITLELTSKQLKRFGACIALL